MQVVMEEKSQTFEDFKNEVLNDYYLALVSREASLMGRREVLTGKAKFGIFGDGKELAQIAMAKEFKNGDFRAGYYRDQTFMMAINQYNVNTFFAGLYAHPSIEADSMSAGRQMGGHFATHSLDENGDWKNLMEQKNSSADLSPTASQMLKLLGLAQASKVYRQDVELANKSEKFTSNGNEVAFGTIGDASTSEGVFFEVINAAGVLQVPMVVSIWDDEHGISVHQKYQTTKQSISEALKGFERTDKKDGYAIFKVKGWDYPNLCKTYKEAVAIAREEHTPVIIHVVEVTQPQGHSTSGSHERYKSKERLQWEQDFDCIQKFKEWILDFKTPDNQILASEEELNEMHKKAKKEVRDAKKEAWSAFQNDIKEEANQLVEILNNISSAEYQNELSNLVNEIQQFTDIERNALIRIAKKALRILLGESNFQKQNLSNWINEQNSTNYERYNSKLYSDQDENILQNSVEAINSEESVDGRIILRENFKALFQKYPNLLTFGEDTGKIGGVNQSMEGLQEEFGELRVSDTGIREASIIGQGIGMAMRGLRPIAEIQYLDYIFYCLQILSDDLATLSYRTFGRQKAPLIVRTRGHRLEGIWHSGSPMGTLLHSLRGMYICVPRNMQKAAGFYNNLLQMDNPALVIEPLNGYRTKEVLPENLAEFTTPLGIPEIVKEGSDITMVSYGSTFNICEKVVEELSKVGISIELIDVQTLLPFDINHSIVKSVEKTNRLLIIDEDVSGGATAFLLDKILVEQNAYQYLDSKPITLSSRDHRPAYGSDGDYFSKPNFDDIYEVAYNIMNEVNPSKYPDLY